MPEKYQQLRVETQHGKRMCYLMLAYEELVIKIWNLL